MRATTLTDWKGSKMWYFSWLLGLPLAAAFAVLNAMWYELMDDRARKRLAADPTVELALEGNKHH
ncbi:cyd operon protein YbgT [Brucella sp. NF 2653]|nr:cyd operon protein YbgT [Brucella sp. 83/13]EFM61518.1 cyd operon protein YbgT [Brucella sp. NF 2653]